MANSTSATASTPSAAATVAEAQKERPPTVRVVIIFNRTGKKIKYDKTYKEFITINYDALPNSALTVATKLKEYFKGLNMSTVDFERDMDKNGISKLAKKLTKQSYGNHDIIVFYYIGHGEIGDHKTGELLPPLESDGQPQRIDELIKTFHNDETEHLRKIPVLFFFDCCLGHDYNGGMMTMGGGLPSVVQCTELMKYTHRIPNAGNILVALSTLPMLKSNCNKKHGPIWSRVLLENLKIDQSISDALHATQREVSKFVCDTDGTGTPKVQPSMFYSTLYGKHINFYAMKAEK